MAHCKLFDVSDGPVQVKREGLRQNGCAGVSCGTAVGVLHQRSFQARDSHLPQLLAQAPPHVIQHVQHIVVVQLTLHEYHASNRVTAAFSFNRKLQLMPSQGAHKHGKLWHVRREHTALAEVTPSRRLLIRSLITCSASLLTRWLMGSLLSSKSTMGSPKSGSVWALGVDAMSAPIIACAVQVSTLVSRCSLLCSQQSAIIGVRRRIGLMASNLHPPTKGGPLRWTAHLLPKLEQRLCFDPVHFSPGGVALEGTCGRNHDSVDWAPSRLFILSAIPPVSSVESKPQGEAL